MICLLGHGMAFVIFLMKSSFYDLAIFDNYIFYLHFVEEIAVPEINSFNKSQKEFLPTVILVNLN
jgi:hypothetical protein